MNTLSKAMREVLLWPYVVKGGQSFESKLAAHLQHHLKFPARRGSQGMKAPVPVLVEQPYGKQSPPDVIIRMASGELRIECKCGQTEGALMWNSGIPDLDTHYLFNCDQGTTIVHGSDLIDQATIDVFMGLKIGGALKRHVESTLPPLSNGWGIGHIRPMFTQDKHERKWFSHPDRVAREKKSISFIDTY